MNGNGTKRERKRCAAAGCKRTFTPVKPWQRYHSARCAARTRQLRHTTRIKRLLALAKRRVS